MKIIKMISIILTILESTMNKELYNNGFVVVKNVYSEEQISNMRQSSLAFFSEGGGFKNAGGHAKPDWIKEDSLSELLHEYNMDKMQTLVSEYVGEEVFFIGHNDLHLNRSVGWHRDQLNGEARKFQIHSPWDTVEDQEMKIYKVNLYLQDHSNNNDALVVRKGSHKFESLQRGIVEQIRLGLGDLIIFDQRLSHKATWSGGYDRLLICMGFGVKNIFFDEFQAGTNFRQNQQNNKNR